MITKASRMRLGSLFLLLTLLFSCTKENEKEKDSESETAVSLRSYDSRVVQDWQNLFLKIERNADGYRPCPTARMLAYMGLGAYEASVSAMPDYKSIAFLYPGLSLPSKESGSEYHYPGILNNVYASLMKRFFVQVKQSDKEKMDSLEVALNSIYSVTVSSEVMDRSKIYGLILADAIWNYSSTDAAGHNKYLDPSPLSYLAPIGSGLWKPTPPGNQSFLFPYWGSARTFAINGTERLCKAPLPYSEAVTSSFYAQAAEVYTQTKPQTAEHQWIAEFWSDDVKGTTFSPAARWISITSQVEETENSNLETAVLAAVKVGLSLNDAAVGCWYSKRSYNVLRPKTYIQETMGDSTWSVYALTSTHFLSSTPSYPGYPSGHAVFAAAAAEVLTSVFGVNYQMTDRSHQNRNDFNGTPRSFSSFFEMAEECAQSRVYLGVNFPMDGDEGLRYGYEIGKKVNALPFRK